MRIRLARDDRGAALIEAALVLPVLLVLIFGMADLSLFLWQQNAAHKAVQIGTRQAVVSPSVAVGPGLTPIESLGYWDGLPLGRSCAPEGDRASACPVFAVACNERQQCACPGFGRCNFRFDYARLAPIHQAMREILPQLRPDQIEIAYATNYLGYVGYPAPVPVNVTVSLVGLRYDLLFLGNLLGSSLAIRASVTLPGENLGRIDADAP